MPSGATVGECAFRHDNQCVFFAIRQIAPLEYMELLSYFGLGLAESTRQSAGGFDRLDD